MTQSPPRIGGQDVESWGDPEDPIVLLIGRPYDLFDDWRRSVRALMEAGRHVLIASAFDTADDPAGELRRLLTDLPSRPALICAEAGLPAVIPALQVTGAPLASCLMISTSDAAFQPPLAPAALDLPIQIVAREDGADPDRGGERPRARLSGTLRPA